jgi:hypothetical protein
VKKQLAFVVVAATVVVASAGVGSAAADPPTDVPVIVDLSDTTSFEDINEDAVLVLEDDDSDLGERIVDGELDSGTPVQIRIYSLDPTADFDLEDVEDAMEDAELNSSETEVEPSEEVFEAEEAEPTPLTYEPTLASAVTPTTISVTWSDLATEAPSLVFLDGEGLTETTEPFFAITDLQPETEYTVEVRPAITNDGEAPLSHVLTLTTLSASGPVANRTTPQTSTEFNMRTFIAPATVDDPLNFGCTLTPGTVFGGDGRSYTAPSSAVDYRTMMAVSVNWGAQTMSVVKDTGLSRLYVNNVLVAAKEAPTTGMKFEEQQISSTFAKVRLNHSAGDPFCAIGAVSYNVVVNMWRSGIVSVIGQRMPVPNFEGWMRWSGGTWKPVLLLQNHGFACLVAICGYQSINASAQADVDLNKGTPAAGSDVLISSISSAGVSWSGRAQSFVHGGVLSPSTSPYLTDFPYLSESPTPGPNGAVTEVRAWVNGVPVSITQTGWTIIYIPGGLLVLDNPNVKLSGSVGKTLFTQFANNGVISFRVSGGGTNVMRLVGLGGWYGNDPEIAPSLSTTLTSSACPNGILDCSFIIGGTGNPAATTTITSGSLPPGLTLDGQVISGDPTVSSGSWTFTVYASNYLGSDSQQYTITLPVP